MKQLLGGIILRCVLSLGAQEMRFQIRADRESCLYACGELATFHVKAVDSKGVPLQTGSVRWPWTISAPKSR